MRKLAAMSPYALAGVFGTAGVTHFLAPHPYEAIVPAPFPARETVYVSGLVELVLAGALAHPRTRHRAGQAAAAFLLAVWPANIKMALDGGQFGSAPLALTWLRVPLQIPLILWALTVARGAETDGSRH